LFSLEPVYLAYVSSITADGRTGDALYNDHARFVLSAKGSDLYKYDLSASADVWITHVAQEFGITQDSEDSTIYFALCRDVFGYVTNVKELSASVYEYVTDSVCLGKPHVGENACYVEVLEYVGKGTAFGKVGRIEGSFGFGVIDLRKPRADASAAYSLKTNYAVCPFDYFSAPSGFWNKLSDNTSLCTAP
jgi:hypothetical protein